MFGIFDPFTAIVTLVLVPLAYFILRKLSVFLRTNMSEALDAVFFFSGRLFKRSLMQAASLRSYCRNALAKDGGSRYLQVPGRETVPLEVDRVFVPITLQTPTGASQTDLFWTLISEGVRARIVGDPGSGKSSLVKKLFRQVARTSPSSRFSKLPILLELKHFTPPKKTTTPASLGKWAYEQARASVTSVEGFAMPQLFDSFVTSKGIVLLLDGLDEVAGDSYEQVASALNELSRILGNKGENNSIVVTMRTQFHQQIQGEFNDEFPQAYHVQPFTPGDIYKFLTLWPFAKHDHEVSATRIFNYLTDHPTLREMCSNPLVLAMYVANDQRGAFESGAPDTRTAFYGDVVEELLVRRRSRQLGTQARSRLLEQRESFFGKLAAENLLDKSQAANSLSWTRAVQIMQETSPMSDAEASSQLRQLAKDTGIISEERPGESFRFIHLTFCEYLAARELAQGVEGGWKILLDKHAEFSNARLPQLRSRLIEVIPFCVASVARSQRPMVLDVIMSGHDSHVQGRCFLETQEYGHPGWSRYKTKESQELVQVPPDMWDEPWLKRLHLFNVVLADEREWGTDDSIASTQAFFENLVRSDTSRLARVFSSFASTDPSAAFRLADAIGFDLIDQQPSLIVANFDNPAFRAITIQKFDERSSCGLSERSFKNWCTIIANAGMSNELIADDLIDRDPIPAMLRSAEELPRSARWYRSGKLPSSYRTDPWRRRRILCPSLYTVAVTLVLARNYQLGDRDIFDINTLRGLRAPGRWMPSWILLLAVMLPYPAFAFLYWLLAGQSYALDGRGTAVLCVATLLQLLTLRYVIGRPFLYAALMHIVPIRRHTLPGSALWNLVIRRNCGAFPLLAWRLTIAGKQLARRTFVSNRENEQAENDRLNAFRSIMNHQESARAIVTTTGS